MHHSNQPTILLVPGAFTCPTCYDLILPHLEREDFPVVVAYLPSSTSERPEEHTAATDGAFVLSRYLMPLINERKDMVVFAHSFGATSFTGAENKLSKQQRKEAGLPGGVLGLIYISFAMCKDGQLQLEHLAGTWSPLCKPNSPSKGLLVFDPVIETLFNDAEPERQKELAKSHLPHSINVFETPVSSPLWTDSAFDGRRVMIKTMLDATFPAEAQQIFAYNCGVQWKIINSDAGHEAILTKPEGIAQIITESTHLFQGH